MNENYMMVVFDDKRTELLMLASKSLTDGVLSKCVFCRYCVAEQLHEYHRDIALIRGDKHGLAIACGNIGFLKFYNSQEAEASVVYQFSEYSLAKELGDFARMGIAFNKIGKLYTKLGYGIFVLHYYKTGP